MNSALAEIILETDRNDYRFENFCCAICSKEHGVEFLPTSKTWDRGRDGRTGGKSTKSHRNLLCATQNRDVDAKVEADLLRVTATSSPEHLIYCSSQRLSEDKVDEITGMVKRHVPSGSLTIYGSIQLGRLAEKHSEIFLKFYHAEIASIHAALERKPQEDEAKLGLRLALITIGSEDAIKLRQTLLGRAVLDCLAEGKKLTVEIIAKQISDALGLPHPLRSENVADIIDQESQAGRIESSPEGFKLTDAGQKQLQAFPPAATEFLLQGRVVIREKIESLIGYRLADQQFEQLWSTLLDFLSGLFYQNGLGVIKSIDAFLKDKSEAVATHGLRELIKQGAHRAAVASATTEDSQLLLETAISDTLVERDGPAFDWLTRVCERFVALCCLGLESKTGEQVKQTLISNRLVLDSDIVLNYLCAHGHEYKAVSDLLARWISIGGKILLAPVVLEEVAYHAWISENDFRETRYLFGRLRPEERSRYIRNAFVTDFHATATNLIHWDLFIGQYKGNSANDYSKIQNYLRTRLAA